MSHPVDKDILSALSGSNENSETENTAKNVESRYSVVIASAKRARQLIDGEEPMLSDADNRKPLSVAIEELSKNLVTIKRGSEVDDEPDYVEDRKDPTFAAFVDDEEEDSEDTDEDGDTGVGEDDYQSDSEA